MNLTIAEELFRKFAICYSNRDIKGALMLFTKDATMFGTGRDEYRAGLDEIKDQLERDWSQASAGKLNLKHHLHASKDGTSWASAIFQAEITIDGKIHIFENLRGSIFVEKDDSGEYKISHMHASFPDPEQPEGNSFKDI